MLGIARTPKPGQFLRAIVIALATLAACGREPDPPAPTPPPPAPAPVKIEPPAERLVAFVRGGNVWTMRPDGSGARAVTSLKDGAASGPSWSPDRRWIAFAAAVDPEFQLTPRNLFVVRPDGTGLRQVTPMPRADRRLDEAPKGVARGRALRTVGGAREPAPGLRVTGYGTRRATETAADGTFQIFLPTGGGWVKIAGDIGGRRWGTSRFAIVREGVTTDLGDITLSSGGDGEPASPSWSRDGSTLAYLFRHSLVDRQDSGGAVALRLIRTDGSRDETIVAPEPASIVAGPALQGGIAWVKTSNGKIFRIDLDTRRVSGEIDAGVGVPDAMALAPDGSTFATLRLEDAGMLAVACVRNGKAETLVTLKPDEGVPRSIDFSPDGLQLLMDRRSAGGSDLWLLTIATRTWTRLTSDGGSSDPVWNGR